MLRFFLLTLSLCYVRAAVIDGSHIQDDQLRIIQVDAAAAPTDLTNGLEEYLRQKRSGYSYSWGNAWAHAWSYGDASSGITAVRPTHGGGTASASALASSQGNAASSATSTAFVSNHQRWRRASGGGRLG